MTGGIPTIKIMLNESQNIEYNFKAGFVESWGRGFKKITEEFERANLPLPTIEENGCGVMAVVMRKVNKVISDHVGVNVGVKSDEIMVYTS